MKMNLSKMPPDDLAALDRRLLREIGDDLQTLAVAIRFAPPERQGELAQQYFRLVLTMAKQQRMIGYKIGSVQSARTAQSPTSVVEKRMRQLMETHVRQLKVLGEKIHQLNLALAREHYARRKAKK